ncbi:hypothetical protein C1H46_035850 [Malus baccata]|uniref:PGG domain-containing protein n=1 Tax=Malus baccata TaxID=106549 RepID=A0A540KX66_MALBA|nr:hypothetical protein C1H46_035850 [Malus baccata]
MGYWRTLAVVPDPNRVGKEGEDTLRRIANLKRPYQCAMEDNWEGVKEYFEENPEELLNQMTVGGDTAFHLAASLSSKSQGKRVLQVLINILRNSTRYAESSALRVPNNNGNNTLHEVSASGNVEAANYLVSNFNMPAPEEIIIITSALSTDKENDALPLLETRNHLGETPLFRAAALGHTDLVKFYAGKLLEDNRNNLWMHFHRNDKMSILHIAVIAQHFETALWLLECCPSLAHQTEDKGLTSLQLLAQMPSAFEPHYQRSKWKMLIYYCLPADGGDVVTPNQKDDVEINLVSNQPRRLSISRNKLSGFARVYSSVWDSLAKRTEGSQGGIIYKIWKDKKNKKSLEKIVPLLVNSDYSWLSSNKEADTKTISLGSVETLSKDGDDDGDEKGKAASKATKSEGYGDDGGKKGKAVAEATKLDKGVTTKVYDSTPLIIATVKGTVSIVKEILEQHPQAVEHIDKNERNILHVAIKHRQKAILKLIKSKPSVMSRLNERIDCDGNTVLHQAADRSYYSISLSQNLIGPAMQLQAELKWRLHVQVILPPHYGLHHNNKDQTAEELFYDEHNELLKSAQEWVKETAQSCSTVAVLVATVVFAAAYAIPGGNDQSGRPVFQDDPLFLLFTCMDVVAIACSLSSVAFFLSVLSSPLEYPLFITNIPRKIMIGFILLFLSMATTMLAFAATVLLLIRVEKKWTKSILYPIAFFPVPLFGLLQFPMYHSCKAMFQKIDAWVLNPFRRILGFSKRTSICGKSKAY